jgi:hypothetical protein
MKSIKLLEGKFKVGTEEKPITTAELIKIVLDAPPEGGFKFSDFVERNRIQDALNKLPVLTGNDLQLEDADYALLKKWTLEVKWGMRQEFIFDFILQFA